MRLALAGLAQDFLQHRPPARRIENLAEHLVAPRTIRRRAPCLRKEHVVQYGEVRSAPIEFLKGAV